LAVLLAGCAGNRDHGGRFEPAGEAACRAVDSLYARSGWQAPFESTGKVTLDVKQYRVQGRYRMTNAGDGNVTFEFSGTMAMGGHHEDVVVSFHDGALYVLDRERGRFYEGDETDELIAEGLDIGWSMAEFVRRVTARAPDCRRLSEVEVDGRGRTGSRLEGRIDGERFRVDFEDGRVSESSWPVISGGRSEDRLSVTYDWEEPSGPEARLGELVAFLEGRRWRMILDAE